MKDDKSFFSLLRGKIWVKPKPEMDRKFWDAFAVEFGRPSLLLRIFSEIPALRLALPALVLAAAGITLYQIRSHDGSRDRPAGSEMALATGVVETEKALDNMELFLSFKDITEISDADWNKLAAPERPHAGS